ncbi:Hypothetical predicted protein [Cloeon dipterum]|uniref:Odorant receptor n=1 Tax=Cloeon dipterum TaxID=197152 RepID=A0A8S1CKW8_9INSE|nr:Hypothetical predicted protein [Cloeon dipterum]
MNNKWKKQLKNLLKINRFFGLWIPYDSQEHNLKKRSIFAWNISCFSLIVICFALVMSTFSDNMQIARLSSWCLPVITFISYCMILFKTAFLFLKSDKLVEIFRGVERVTFLIYLGNDQSPYINQACKIVTKTVLILLALDLISILIGLKIFSDLNTAIFSQNSTVTDDLKISNELFRVTSLNKFAFIVLGLHSIFGIYMPLRVAQMDSIVYFFHAFITQELIYLKHNMSRVKKKLSQNKLAFVHVNNTPEAGLDQWIAFYQEVKCLHQKVDKVFGMYIAVNAALITASICFIVFIIARGDSLSREISRISGRDVDLSPTLHLLAADVQKTFVVHGGPFFVLNLEFFATTMGAVLSYLIIMWQVKD